MQFAEYLETVGLRFNPFGSLEASSDPNLISYLVNNEAFEKAWQSEGDSRITGESGSGRTAVAERLAYECRTASDRKKVFPVLLGGEQDLLTGNLETAVNRTAGLGVLLEVVYHPERFEGLNSGERLDVIHAIETAAPGAINHLLPQVIRKGSMKPLSELIDPSSSMLPNQPSAGNIKNLAGEIIKLNNPAEGKSSPSIFDIITTHFGFTEIKLIADFPSEPTRESLGELDRIGDVASKEAKVSKVVLSPAEEDHQSQISIDWSPEQLSGILRARIGAASNGSFESLDGLSDPSLTHIEDKIVTEAGNRGKKTPRSVISLAARLLSESAKSPDSLWWISQETFRNAVNNEFAKLS